MKPILTPKTIALLAGLLLLALAAFLIPSAVQAADNTATFNLNGVAQPDSNTFVLNSFNAGNIALSKAAIASPSSSWLATLACAR